MHFNPTEHYRNREFFPEKELEKYYGKQVAWSLDGTKILASAEDPRVLPSAMERLGISSQEVVTSYVPFPNETFFGSALLGVEE